MQNTTGLLLDHMKNEDLKLDEISHGEEWFSFGALFF